MMRGSTDQILRFRTTINNLGNGKSDAESECIELRKVAQNYSVFNVKWVVLGRLRKYSIMAV